MERAAQADAVAATTARPGTLVLAFAQQRLVWLTLAASQLLTFLVYWPVLSFSYFHDDVYDLPRTEDKSYWQLFSAPLPGNRYYRPVTYALWKAVHDVTGEYPALLLHALPLLCHALSGWLLYLLVKRLTGSEWALLAALLFVLYPFSYQALAIMGALFHPLVTLALLAMLVLWYDGRTRRSRSRLALAGVCAALALWSHEYGVAAVPLLLALELLLLRRRVVARPSWWLALPLAAELLFIGLWFSFDRPPGDNITAGEVLDNLAFWLQGMTYPISRQAGWLAELLRVNAGRLGTALGLVALGVALAGYWLAGRIWLGLTLLSFALLSFLPATLTLTHEYILSGPRLLYIVAPACAAFWGLLPGLCIGARPRRASDHPARREGARPLWFLPRAWHAATLALLAVAIVQSLLFIERRLEMFAYGSQAAEGVIGAARASPNAEHLVINLPAWFALKEQEYPRGYFGIQVEATYFGLDSLVYIATDQWISVASRSLAPRTFEWRYYLQPHGSGIDHAELDQQLRDGTRLSTVELLPGAVVVREPGTLAWGQPWPDDYAAVFGDALWLLGSELSQDGALATITTEWFSVHQLEGDYLVWFQVRRNDGTVVAEVRDYALSGMSPPRLWRPVDRIQDRRLLMLPESGDGLTVWAALASAADGRRLPVALSNGQQLTDGWYELGTVD